MVKELIFYKEKANRNILVITAVFYWRTKKYQNKLSEEDHLMSTDVTIIIGTLPVWNEIISVN